MTLWRLLAAFLVGAFPVGGLAGCAGTGAGGWPGLGGGSDGARLAVGVQRGFPTAVAASEPAAESVAVLMDMTPSMAAATEIGVGRFVAAREAAVDFVAALPPEIAVAVHAIGTEEENDCGSGLRSGGSESGGERGALLADLSRLEPAGEGSLAGGLAALRNELAAAGELPGARIVIYTDLVDRCGGDLCDAVNDALGGGARVDLVLFGDAAEPLCADDPGIAARDGGEAAEPVSFRVAPTDRPARGVKGVADGELVEVPAGPVEIVVDLEPPLRFDAVPLLPGGSARLTVVDFPALDPPVREWFWELDTAAPPADEAEATTDGS